MFAVRNGSVVQLDRISDFGSEGWEFESLRDHTVKKAALQKAAFFVLKKQSKIKPKIKFKKSDNTLDAYGSGITKIFKIVQLC